MYRLRGMVVILCLCWQLTGWSQNYHAQNKAIVIFNASVFINNDDTYIYSYLVTSSTRSEEVFNDFTLYLVDSLLTSNQTIIEGPTNKKWYIDGESDQFIGGSPASRTLDLPPENGLAPGESIKFSFKSMGLPSINLFYARSFAPQYSAAEYDSLLGVGYTQAQLSPDWKDNAYKGLTIAPHIFYSPITTLTFLDTLLSYTRQSAELGWLAPMHSGRRTDWDDDCDNDERPQDGIAGNIERRLKLAQRELQREDSVKARKELQTLLQKVERIWKRSQDEDKKKGRDRKEELRNRNDRIIMTSEAYALLKYNLEYLIERLPEKARREREPRRQDQK